MRFRIPLSTASAKGENVKNNPILIYIWTLRRKLESLYLILFFRFFLILSFGRAEFNLQMERMRNIIAKNILIHRCRYAMRENYQRQINVCIPRLHSIGSVINTNMLYQFPRDLPVHLHDMCFQCKQKQSPLISAETVA